MLMSLWFLVNPTYPEVMDAIINVAMSSMKQQNKNKSASIKGFEYHIRSNL